MIKIFKLTYEFIITFFSKLDKERSRATDKKFLFTNLSVCILTLFSLKQKTT